MGYYSKRLGRKSYVSDSSDDINPNPRLVCVLTFRQEKERNLPDFLSKSRRILGFRQKIPKTVLFLNFFFFFLLLGGILRLPNNDCDCVPVMCFLENSRVRPLAPDVPDGPMTVFPYQRRAPIPGSSFSRVYNRKK